MLFRTLATLRTDIPLFETVDELKWAGPTPAFAPLAKKLDAGSQTPSGVERESPTILWSSSPEGRFMSRTFERVLAVVLIVSAAHPRLRTTACRRVVQGLSQAIAFVRIRRIPPCRSSRTERPRARS